VPTNQDQPKKDIRFNNTPNVKVDVKDSNEIHDEVLEMNQKRLFIKLSRLMASGKCKYLYIFATIYALALLVCSIVSIVTLNTFIWLYIIDLLGLMLILLDVIVRIYLYVLYH
jgi:hypothetical protein